jgi:hypothetical protein
LVAPVVAERSPALEGEAAQEASFGRVELFDVADALQQHLAGEAEQVLVGEQGAMAVMADVGEEEMIESFEHGG